MFTQFIRIFCIYICTIPLCIKIINFRITHRLHQYLLVLFSFALAILSSILKYVHSEFIYLFPLLLLWLIIAAITFEPQKAFISVILSFCITYTLHTILSLGVLFLFYLIPLTQVSHTTPTLAFTTSVFHIICTYYLCKFKRFKKGLPFLFLKHRISFSTCVSLTFIAFSSSRFMHSFNKYQKFFFLFIVIALLAFLIHWWQAQITKSYRHSVRERELESLRLEVQEKDKQLKELSKKNEQMGHLIHEDTKIIRTFISGLEDYVETDFSDEGTRKDKGKELLEVVYEHADERLGTIRNICHKEYATYSTNIEALNLQLNHFSKRASIEDITFHVHIACNLEDYIPKSISTTDLSHLLSNLLDNAFIAASYTENPTIQLQLYEVSNCLVIEIADSGIPFEVESLVSFGLIQRTTHENEGGSGIGLIEIWNLKEKYHATLHLEEYEQPCPYSKKLSLNFNHKNHFSIRTFRKKEIQYVSKRIDLQIYE